MAKKEIVPETWKPKTRFFPSSTMHKVAHWGYLEIHQSGYTAKSEQEENELIEATKRKGSCLVTLENKPLPETKGESDIELKTLRKKTLEDDKEKSKLLAELEQLKAELEERTSPSK